MKLPTKRVLFRSFYFIITIFIVVLILPRSSEQRYSYTENRPWNYSLLTAPFDIPIFRDSVSVRILTDSIKENFIPVYKRDSELPARINKALSANGTVDASQLSKIKAVIDRLYAAGIVDNYTASEISSGKLPYVRMVRDNELRTLTTRGLRSQRSAYMVLDSMFRNADENRALQSLNLSQLLSPNITIDTLESNKLLTEALYPATAAIGVIQQGERIIDRGDIVNPQLYQVLLTYESMMENRELTKSTEALYTDAGAALYMILLMGAVYFYFFLYRRKMWDNERRILCVLSLLVLFYILGVILGTTFRAGLFIIPFTILPILIVVFYDARSALFIYLVELLMCLPMSSFSLEFVFVEFIAGLAAIFSMKELSRRSQLLQTAGLVFIAYAISYISVELMMTGTFSSLSWRIMGFFGINAVLISFAYIMIFVVEKVFGFISIVTLVELSDINNPLLLSLSEECPGTFQHSMAVSNLASEAARKIGANVQLVRTGALYHDIGKLSNPAFFTENQHGVNPHDALNPEQSANIIIGHIREGLKRAEKANLPQVIKDMISQHHGKGKAKYFYITECKKRGEENVNPELFTYPGPNPQSLEASLIMMADAVEAASRSLPEHSQEAITGLVNRIIDGQISEGLHDNSPLSFRDINMIKQSFINRLRTMYHARIAYPSDIKPSKPESGPAAQ